MTSTAETAQAQEAAAATWWVLLIQGIAAGIIGLLLITNTAPTLTFLILILGIYWIIAGIFNIIAVLTKHITEHRFWVVIAAIIGILAGIIVLQSPIYSTLIITSLAILFLAIASLINGIIMIFAGRQTDSGSRERSWGGFFLGLFYVIIGVILLLGWGDAPILSARALALALGLWGIIGGIILVVLSFQVKKLGDG